MASSTVPAEVSSFMQLWDLPPEYPSAMQMATEYAGMLQSHRYFTSAVAFNAVMGGELKLFVAVSSAESTRLFEENLGAMRTGQPIVFSYWTAFDVWEFRGLVLGNIAGMTQPEHDGHPLRYSFGELLTSMAKEVGVQGFQSNLGHPGGPDTLVARLGMALTRLGIASWIHYSTGLSMNHFRGVDVYVKHLCPALLDSNAPEAWYVANVGSPWYQRRCVRAEEWWSCPDWLSVGQRMVSFAPDPRVEQAVAMVYNDPDRGMMQLSQQFGTNPEFMKTVLDRIRYQQPNFVLNPSFRAAYVAYALASKMVRDRAREEFRRRAFASAPVPSLPPFAEVRTSARV